MYIIVSFEDPKILQNFQIQAIREPDNVSVSQANWVFPLNTKPRERALLSALPQVFAFPPRVETMQ